MIGVGHGGSTSLWKALALHPQLEPSVLYTKSKPGRELWFFNERWDPKWSTAEARAEYSKFFPILPTTNLKAAFEKTPTYWHNVEVPRRMSAVAPNATLVWMLRNPVTWLYSRFYNLQMKYEFYEASEHGSIEEPLKQFPPQAVEEANLLFSKKLNGGMDKQRISLCDDLVTAAQIWTAHYPRESIIVERSEAFADNPVAVLRKIEAALGLTPYDWPTKALKAHRWLYSHRPELDTRLLQIIHRQCHAPISKLEKLFGIELLAPWGFPEVTPKDA